MGIVPSAIRVDTATEVTAQINISASSMIPTCNTMGASSTETSGRRDNMGFSTAQLVDMQHRLARSSKVKSLEPNSAFEGPESKLHEKIIEDLQRRRWWFCHSRTDKRTTQQLGCPDFIVAAPLGVSWFIEVKKKGGKLTKEQNIARHCLVSLDHIHSMVFSMGDYETEVKRVEYRVSQLAVV